MPITTPTLETRRLLLRPLRLDDAEATQELFPHWEIVRHLSGLVPWPYLPDGAKVFYRDVTLPAVAAGQQWIWAIELKGGPGHLVGSINLRQGNTENRGFWLGLPWHGQGLMMEACKPVVRFWFIDLQQPRLRVGKALSNIASRRISQKEGMRLVGTEVRTFTGGVPKQTEIYELTREEWQRREGGM
jgi:RimJ/RimL family protein N-acetyltransferase